MVKISSLLVPSRGQREILSNDCRRFPHRPPLVRKKLCLTGSTMKETFRVDKKPKARRNGGAPGGARLAPRLPNWYDCSPNSFVYLFLVLRTFRHARRARCMAQYLYQGFHFWLSSDGFSVSPAEWTRQRLGSVTGNLRSSEPTARWQAAARGKMGRRNARRLH